MARVNNLTNFLNDVATAIKTKLGDNTPIPASDFDTEILSIETAGNYQSKTLNVTQNGNYNLLPDTGYDAMSNVIVEVSVPTTGDATYAELFAIADNIYNPDIPDDSATANFTIDDEQVCLQRALKILKGAI